MFDKELKKIYVYKSKRKIGKIERMANEKNVGWYSRQKQKACILFFIFLLSMEESIFLSSWQLRSVPWILEIRDMKCLKNFTSLYF